MDSNNLEQNAGNAANQAVDVNQIGPMMVDENGMPIGTPPPDDQGYPQQQPMVQPGTGEPTQQELDQAFPPQQQQPQVRRPPPYPQPQPQQPPPDPRSVPPPDPSQPRPDAA